MQDLVDWDTHRFGDVAQDGGRMPRRNASFEPAPGLEGWASVPKITERDVQTVHEPNPPWGEKVAHEAEDVPLHAPGRRSNIP